TDSSSALYSEKETVKPKHPSLMLPKFSFSVDDSPENKGNVYETNLELLVDPLSRSTESANTSLPSKITIPGLTSKQAHPKSRAVIKSASASGLSLIIPNDESLIKPVISS